MNGFDKWWDTMRSSELDAQIEAYAQKVDRVIEKARSKMTPAEREQADKNATDILNEAMRRNDRHR